MNHRPFIEGGCRNCACGTFRLGGPEEPEPPMTPEEEEQAPEDGKCACGEPEAPETVHRTDGPCFVKELPPQPDRRPPYAVAYSVSGHLYEVALPGDATVRAVDGALVITHHLGPVAGIVQVLPVASKED
ncbi:hypothetical protein ABZY09_30505 [Streptomyces sp. NPDC002928]|uniref:hypothetical protein n=1 Tax=Streptomyces sp. NPDC002928 TaxID=3154440 RepID=UPI0033A30812